MQSAKCPQGKILALGELLVDFVPCQADMLISQPGAILKTASGSSGIFACAAASMGASVGFLGKVGRDALSRMVDEAIRAAGVDMSRVVYSDEGQIGLAFIEYLPGGKRNYQYYRSRSVGSLYRAQEIDEAYLSQAFAVHFPGMLLELTEEMRGACLRAAELAKQHGVLLSFDPNIRMELMREDAARARMLEVLALADVIAPTLEEGRFITGKQSIGDVLRALHALGPQVVALTRDKDGAVLSMDGQVVLAGGIDVPVEDPTGAGDTFAAALVYCLQQGMSLRETALFCNCAGTLVCTKRGAIPALPTAQQVRELAAQRPCTLDTIALAGLA